MNAIRLVNLTKEYKDFTLDRINLSLPRGAIMGLIGENGSGKSTTIKLILELIQKDSGEIQLLDKDYKLQNKEEIGVVMDETGIPPFMKTKQINNIMKNIYSNWDSDKFHTLLDTLSIPSTKPLKDFSRGMKMKLGIAIALSHNAKLLILDEATSGLDPVVRDQVLDILNEYTRDEEHSILISSHIVSDLEKICDYIAFLKDGKLILLEEKDTLYESYGFISCSKSDFKQIPIDAIRGTKETKYGIEAIVCRSKTPHHFHIQAITIEDLFLFMSKEVRK